MAKECKKCKKTKEECTCPKKGKVGYYGLDDHDKEDSVDMDMPQDSMSEALGALGEPRADKLEKMSGREKRKSLADFKAATDEAKKRQSDKETRDRLAYERMTKGVRFHDKKGSGYLKGGKKHYD